MELLVGVVQVFDEFDLGVEQLYQQAVAIAQVVGVVGACGVFQQGDTAQAQLGRQGGGLAHMVGLDRTGGDQRIGALGQGIGGEVFELAQFVAAHGQGRGVVALDVDITAQPGRQSFKFFQGGGATQQFQTIKTVELLFDHGHARVRGDGKDYRQGFCAGNCQLLMLCGY